MCSRSYMVSPLRSDCKSADAIFQLYIYRLDRLSNVREVAACPPALAIYFRGWHPVASCCKATSQRQICLSVTTAELDLDLSCCNPDGWQCSYDRSRKKSMITDQVQWQLIPEITAGGTWRRAVRLDGEKLRHASNSLCAPCQKSYLKVTS